MMIRNYGLGLVVAFALLAPASVSARERGPVTIDLVQVDVHDVLRLLAEVGHVNIVCDDDVGGTITLKLRDVGWERALETVVRAKGLEMARDRNIIRVAKPEAFAKERAARLSAHEACLESAPLRTWLVPVSYANAQDLVRLVQPRLTRRGSVVVDERTNTLVIRDVECE